MHEEEAESDRNQQDKEYVRSTDPDMGGEEPRNRDIQGHLGPQQVNAIHFNVPFARGEQIEAYRREAEETEQSK